MDDELLKSIIENAYEAFVGMDERGVITAWNAQAETIFGWSRAEALGRTVAETIIPPQHRERHLSGLAHFRATGEGPVLGKRIEMTALRRDGSEFPVELSISPLKTGGAWTFHAFIADISERKRGEEALREAERIEALGHLAGEIAQDFNRLVTAITKQSTFLMGCLDQDDRLRDGIEEIRNAAGQAAVLTNNLLAFSSGQIMHPMRLDLNALLTGLRGMLEWQVGKQIELATKLDPSLEWVNVDPKQIEQVIVTIVGHSRDAMGHRGNMTLETSNVTIDKMLVHKHGVLSPGRYVALAINDDGPGIDALALAALFEPFSTRKGRKRGSGIGLASAYGIIKQSSGTIIVSSEPDKGTSFKIYLPSR